MHVEVLKEELLDEIIEENADGTPVWGKAPVVELRLEWGPADVSPSAFPWTYATSLWQCGGWATVRVSSFADVLDFSWKHLFDRGKLPSPAYEELLEFLKEAAYEAVS